MEEDLVVRFAGLADAGAASRGLVSTTEAIGQRARTADVTDAAWGLVGLTGLYPSYCDMLPAAYDHMAELSAAVAELGDKLTATAELYQQTEDAIVAAITAAVRELESERWI